MEIRRLILIESGNFWTAGQSTLNSRAINWTKI